MEESNFGGIILNLIDQNDIRYNVDLHSHTTFSDGFETIENSISIRREHISGLKYIGISDHFYMMKNGRWKEYLSEVNRLKENDAGLLLGVELLFTELQARVVPDELLEECDYIIIEDFERYEPKSIIEVLKSILTSFNGLIILAHPDYSCLCYGVTEYQVELFHFCYQNGIYIELNCSTGYFIENGLFSDTDSIENDQYWRILMDTKASQYLVIGTDAHEYFDEEISLLANRFNQTRCYLHTMK